MLGKFNSFIEKWMAFVTPACLLMGVYLENEVKNDFFNYTMLQ